MSAPLFDLGIVPVDGGGETFLALPCKCMYSWEGHMGWQNTAKCATHAAQQAALALQMFDFQDHVGHKLTFADYHGTLCLECRTCERTLLEVWSAAQVVTP
jgi:hypothetical protein